jgi:DNA-binding response OmpR family regulator
MEGSMSDRSAAGLTVVIADDDPDILALTTIAVGRAGLVLLASEADGTSALASIQEHRPDIALLDVSMPGMTGLEITRAMRESEELANSTIFLLSAAVDQTAVDAGFAAGADAYMTKPFSPRTLAAQIVALIEAPAAPPPA